MSETVEKRAWVVMLVGAAVLLVIHIVDQHWVRAGVWGAVVLVGLLRTRRRRHPETERDADVTWAPQVLAQQSISADDTVRATRELRRAEPQLDLMAAKQLVEATKRNGEPGAEN